MPNTLDAILMCGECTRPTLHLFHERRPQPKTPGPAAVGPIFVDLIYVCDLCETERIFGNEPVSAEGWASDREMREEHAALVHGQWDNPEPCGPNCPLEQSEDR